jgi:HPt (histidine-containing phosphotransfer) domain-containing protein
MMELSAKADARDAVDDARPADAPSLAPVEPAIDHAHLTRMTQGERDLEREVLALFATQIDLLLGRMRAAAPKSVAALAHTLKGSARGVGAWKLATAADALEVEAAAGRDPDSAMKRLAAAARQAQTEITELMHTG